MITGLAVTGGVVGARARLGLGLVAGVGVGVGVGVGATGLAELGCVGIRELTVLTGVGVHPASAMPAAATTTMRETVNLGVTRVGPQRSYFHRDRRR